MLIRIKSIMNGFIVRLRAIYKHLQEVETKYSH